MKLHVCLLILAHCWSIFGAHTNVWDKPDAKVMGGQNSSPSRHPYLVSLQTRFFIIRAHICGGTLLNENWILTAAHCVTGSYLVKWLPLDAIVGASKAHEVQANRFGPGTQIGTVDQRIPHPNYVYGIGPNDIAVLHSSTSFKFTKDVRPALLPIQFKTNFEQPLQLVGWGILRTTPFFPDLPNYLQEVNVTYINYTDCYKAVDVIKDIDEVNPLVEESNICTGPISGGVSACSGDSGGPLIQLTPKHEVNNNIDDNTIEDDYPLIPKQKTGEGMESEVTPVVIGVVSWGSSPCGDLGAPTVYTKVENFVDFINKHVTFSTYFYFITYIITYKSQLVFTNVLNLLLITDRLDLAIDKYIFDLFFAINALI